MKDPALENGRMGFLEHMMGIYRQLAEYYCVILMAIESQGTPAKEQERQALLKRAKESEILFSIPGVEPTGVLAYLGVRRFGRSL